jgi:predicted ATPase
VAALEAELEAIDPTLVARAPLLSTLVDLPIPDNDLTSPFDAKLRKTSLEGLLVDCLRDRASAGSLLILLEDCHWLDPLSRDLAEILGRAVASLPVVLVLAYRPGADADAPVDVDRLPHFHEIALTELGAAEATELVRAKLAQSPDGGHEPPAALVGLVTTKAQGNPFYIEELVDYIRGQGVDLRDGSALERLQLPGSLHSLVLSRIDMLAESPRRTLKVASVLGRTFRATVVSGVYPELGGLDEVEDHLKHLDAAALVHLDDPVEATYVFKHVVTQEVAYESMPYAFRSLLHERCGRYLEHAEPDAVERNLDLLAHHYGRSENLAKKREYLARAGDAAQAAYANAAAIAYFQQLVPLVAGAHRVEALLKLGKVLELVGEWSHAEKVVAEALGLAQSLGDRLAYAGCETALAEIARKQGRYEEAVARLERAAREFGTLSDDAGVGRVLHLAGTVAAQRGDYAKATENYEASLAIRERLGDKASMGALLSNLGIVVEYQGDLDAARRFHERALALRTETGDRWAIAVSTNNLGLILAMQRRFDEARTLLERSMQLSREVGDGWLVAIGHNNLGNTTRGLGDYDAARSHYHDSLRAYRDFDDKWAMAILLEDIGMLAALTGDAPAALELAGAADALRVAIGAPRAPPQEEEIEAKLNAAAASLSEQERTAHRTRGRALDLAGAIERALCFCGPST